jgi:segregation and condensation protein A
VTEQYINYLHTLQEFDMEVATGFVVMAALLLCRSNPACCCLRSSAVDGEEEADPRQMLVDMLVEYRRVKATCGGTAGPLSSGPAFSHPPAAFCR